MADRRSVRASAKRQLRCEDGTEPLLDSGPRKISWKSQVAPGSDRGAMAQSSITRSRRSGRAWANGFRGTAARHAPLPGREIVPQHGSGHAMDQSANQASFTAPYRFQRVDRRLSPVR